MATSIAFGLAFATVLVLLLVPSLLAIYENSFLGRRATNASGELDQSTRSSHIG